MLTNKPLYKRWMPSILLIPIVVLLIINGGRTIFLLDTIDLLIHEGGHGIFKIFGEGFLYTLGGTLMQIIIPSLFVGYYFYTRKKFITQLSLLWLGHNFMNIGIYAADAQERALPLLGGKKVYHDWHYMLRELQLIKYVDVVGQIFFWLGIVSFVLVFLIPTIIKDYDEVSLDLKT
ncbi:MAG: hypothetical protein V1720_19815 [bacterium]